MILLSMFTITKEQSVSMNLEARLIRLKEKLDAKALRDPRTVKEYAVRNKWERVSNILRKRYNRYGDGVKLVVNDDK